ncbi:MAG: zeta toxin family protein [Bacteroidaceae bacterium]|nr:zeta toxin family protein [Bacteroidaceae bacterium]
MNRTLYIIAGCNGAGKTTASMNILPEILDCKEFVNADEIARGLSLFDPDSVAIEAGRLMLQRIDMLLEGTKSFAIETTLATRSYKELVMKAHKKGFKVLLLFFWLPSVEYAVRRVAQRVAEGGHNISTDIIKRRYHKGIENLFNIYMPIVDSWALIANNTNPPVVIASNTDGGVCIYDEELYQIMKSYV